MYTPEIVAARYEFVAQLVEMILCHDDKGITSTCVEVLERFQERELLEIEIETVDDVFFIVLSFNNMGGSQVRVHVPEGDGAHRAIRETLEEEQVVRCSIWKAN